MYLKMYRKIGEKFQSISYQNLSINRKIIATAVLRVWRDDTNNEYLLLRVFRFRPTLFRPQGFSQFFVNCIHILFYYFFTVNLIFSPDSKKKF